MGRVRDVIIGRRGDSLTGRLLDTAFDIQSDLGKLRVTTDRIAWIHFRNPPQAPDDEIWLVNGDRLSGAIEQEAVDFQPEGGERNGRGTRTGRCRTTAASARTCRAERQSPWRRFSSYCAAPSTGTIQDSRRFTQVSASGFRSNGASSSVPSRISTWLSPGSEVSIRREPQRGQKPRPSKLEMSPLSSKSSSGQCA